MEHQYDDGGRNTAGYKGKTGDCVARSVAIASGLPYQEVYAALAQGTGGQTTGKHKKRAASAANGISVKRKWFKDYMVSLGFVWVPTMGIGTGCRVHLVKDELPMGNLVVSVSKHYTAVINGVIRDTWDPQRNTYCFREDGTTQNSRRCVYGYWLKK